VDGPISNQIGVAAKIAILTETWQTSKSKTNTKRRWRRETLSTEVSICTKEALVVFMAPQQLATIARVMTSYKTLCFTLRKSRKDLKSCLSIISRLKARSTKRLRKNAAAHQTEVSELTIILRSRTKHKLLRALSSQAVFMEVMITSSISRCSP